MKKYIFCLFLILSISFFYSCAPVTIKGNKEELKNHKEMALVEVLIAPHTKPILPLIDAALFNSDLDDIVADIIDYNLTNINKYENHLGLRLNEYLKFKVLYGDTLLSSEKYIALKDKVKTYSIDFDDEDFPQIIIPEKSYNFFDFHDNTPSEYSEEDFNLTYGDNISNICKELGVDGVIAATTGIFPIPKPGLITANWSRANITSILFFDKDGRRFLSLYYNSDEIDGDGDDINNYISALDKFYGNVDFMLQVLFDLKENKKIKLSKRSTGRIKK